MENAPSLRRWCARSESECVGYAYVGGARGQDFFLPPLATLPLRVLLASECGRISIDTTLRLISLYT